MAHSLIEIHHHSYYTRSTQKSILSACLFSTQTGGLAIKKPVGNLLAKLAKTRLQLPMEAVTDDAYLHLHRKSWDGAFALSMTLVLSATFYLFNCDFAPNHTFINITVSSKGYSISPHIKDLLYSIRKPPMENSTHWMTHHLRQKAHR